MVRKESNCLINGRRKVKLVKGCYIPFLISQRAMVLKGNSPLHPHKWAENYKTTNSHLLKIQNLLHYHLPHVTTPFQLHQFSINKYSTLKLPLTFYKKLLLPIMIGYFIHTFYVSRVIFVFRHYFHVSKSRKFQYCYRDSASADISNWLYTRRTYG